MESRLVSPSSSRSRSHSKLLPLKEAKMRSSWANFPGDLLPVIAEKASTTNTEYVNLRVVCKAWRRALTPHPHHLPPQVPWLMLPELPHNTRRRLGISDPHVSFYDIARSRTYRLPLPYMMSGKYYCGSSHGWLVLEHQPRVSLLNPITGRFIDLPPLDALPTLSWVAKSKGETYVPSDPNERYTNRILKASLSCTPSKPGCVVVAVFISSSLSNSVLGFCRIGDSQWTELKKWGAGPMLDDFVFYNNLVYTVNYKREISVYNLEDRSLWTFPSKIPYSCPPDRMNLVAGDTDSSGPLVVRTIEDLEEEETKVYVYKWCDDRQKWRQVKDIGKRVLFLDEGHSFILQWDKNQENKVYYYRRHYVPTESFQIGINWANLKSREEVPHKLSPMEVFPSICGMPLWVTPSLS